MVNNLAFKQNAILVNATDIKKDEVKWCSVSLTEVITTGKRLEATVFDVELKNAKRMLENSKYPLVYVGGKSGLVTSYRPGICKRIFVQNAQNNIPMFTPSQITDIFPKSEKYLSSKMKDSIGNWFVKEGELLLTCSGTIGKTTIVTRTLRNKCFSQNMIRICPKNKVDLGYLYCFFNSKIGQLILTRNNYGAVIQHIDPSHLEAIQVPNPPMSMKDKMSDLILSSFKLRDESNELIDKATNMLIQELNLPPIQKFKVDRFDKGADVVTFSVALSEIRGRVDASFHVPITKAIVEHLKLNAKEVTIVGDDRISKQVILPGRFKRVYVEEGQGRVFFGGKQLNELDPTNKKYLSDKAHSMRIKKELEILENTILVSRSGTIGKIAMAPKHWEHWIASDHIIRIVPSSKNIAGYLTIFLSTDYGYELIKRFTYGSVVDEIDDKQVSQIEVPLLKNAEIQAEINALSLEANAKRFEAYKLEQKAMGIMDNEVIFAK